MRRFLIYFPFFVLFFIVPVSSQPLQPKGQLSAEDLASEMDFSTPWVDSVINSLSLEQRIGQLIMIAVHTDQGRDYYNLIERQIRDHKLGGVVFFKGGPVRQVQITNRLQAAATTPLLVAMDAEWGPAMRLDSVMAFPYHLTMGAIAGEGLVYEMGLEAGRQLSRLGVHMCFGPVVDVNTNPDNPVVNYRSFGESRFNVAQKGIAYMRGLQNAGVIASAKHFPGHGDTHTDSHHTLPLIDHSREELDSIHIYPFRRLIENGLQSVMVGHLEVPSIEAGRNLASSLSYNVISELLIKDLGFKGLVISDALNMRGVSDHFKSGDLELRALKAGNDLLLMPGNIPLAIHTIRDAVLSGDLEEEALNHKVRKVLYYKQKAGLDRFEKINPEHLIGDLNSSSVNVLNKRLAQAAVSLIRNQEEIIPVRNTEGKRIAVLSIGQDIGNPFQSMLGKYAELEQFSLPKNHNEAQTTDMLRRLREFELVVVGLHRNNHNLGRNYGISHGNIAFLSALTKRQAVIISVFANPYSLRAFGDIALEPDGLIVAYQDGQYFEEAAAQVIIGGLPAKGRLPVSIPPHFPVYKGIQTPENFRISFSEPEEAGIQAQYLNAIDSLARMGIDSMAYPGCQIAIVKDGKLFYHKAFGFHTYFNRQPVTLDDLYDLASVTKVVATTASVMRLTDEGKVNLQKNLGHYLPWLKKSDKEKIGLRDLLAHQGRLRPWIPFFNNTLEDGKPRDGIFSPDYSEEFPVKVADGLFIHQSFRDTLFGQIMESPLLRRRNYRYSDLGFIMLTELVERQSGLTLDQYVANTFYKPLGLRTITFNPLEKFPANRIVPSENDTLFRKQILRGYVNDPNAAMLGGVSGHAGLFSNALDLAVFMQMLLQGGEYAGHKYLDPTTVREFTRVQFAGNRNRRGLGFDKPAITPANGSPACHSASPLSYGHTGFTGTFVWVDPKENLVFVFLSNRTFPYPSNGKISELDIRINMQQAIYDAIEQSRPKVLSDLD
ncbi:MAG: glycoside hydrolase family 3 N-terminal domain-containing protein [Bacteroides sp.]|nr:glycoside hydrolase family 3 N-terminal domain-containing protein [Bacteroides sp.]